MSRVSHRFTTPKGAGTSKSKISKESLRQALILFTYLKPYRGQFIWGLVFIAASAFTTSLFPFLLGKMIDSASPGASLPGMGTTFQFDFGLKNIKLSLNTNCFFFHACVPVNGSR